MVGKDQIVAGQAVLARGLEERSEPADAIYPGKAGILDAPMSGETCFLKISGTNALIISS